MHRWIGVALTGLAAACSAEHAPTRAVLPSASVELARSSSSAEAPPSASAAPSEAPVAAPPPEPAPAVVEQIPIEGDQPASFVRAPDGSAPKVVFLAGICTIGYAYLMAFPEAARAHGGALTLEGDQPCPGYPDYRSFSSDADKQEKRIEAALTALVGGDVALPAGGFTLVGYSRGATIAERLSHKWPDRYPRVVLIGSPSEPNAELLSKARAVATMSCSKDVPWRMKGALTSLRYRKIPAEYFEMPDCTHGQVTEGDRVFGEAFTWLEEHQKMPE
ncbi:MAG: alpha/beta hydrolase [Polyangiaceae bacterium]